MPPATDREPTLKLARRARGVTPRDLAEQGIHRQVLTRLVAQGQIERVARGVYRLPEHPITANHGFALAAAAVTPGTICLLSALQYHGIGTQLPSEVWMALDNAGLGGRGLHTRPWRILRYSGAAMSAWRKKRIGSRAGRCRSTGQPRPWRHRSEYRNEIGLDVAMEALREGWRARRFTMDELDRLRCNLPCPKVMRPYLEALAA